MAYSQTVEVVSSGNFTTASPSKTMAFQLLEPLNIDDGLVLDAGTCIKGDVVDVKSPKRLKRNAKFSVEKLQYTDKNDEIVHLSSNIKATYSKPIDKKRMAKNAALGVGSHFFKGLSMGVAAIEGAVENEEGNRIKSSAHSLYEASPLSYIEKGKDIVINQSDIFYLKFKGAKVE